MSTMRDTVMDLASNAKVGIATAATTAGSGIGTVLDYIPDDIGKLATLVGLVVSGIVGYAHWQLAQKSKAETELLKKELLERRKRLNDDTSE